MQHARFLTAKRYPHPDGLKRRPGEVVAMDDATANAWTAAGLVEIVRDEPTNEPAPNPEPKAGPKPKVSKAKRR